MNLTLSNISEKLTGLLIIVVNVFWLVKNVNLLYQYHFTDILFAYMIPNWVLIFNSLLAVLGVWIGTMILIRKFNLLKWGAIDFGLILVGGVLEIAIVF